MSKPREFWIPWNKDFGLAENVTETKQDVGDRCYSGYEARRYYSDEVYHVIEKSAYDELELDYNHAHEKALGYAHACGQLQHKLDRAVEALKKVASKCLDEEPPFRYAPDEPIQDMARKTLKELGEIDE